MDQSQIQAVRDIIKPRSVIITTRYFWQKWRPLLGNSLAVLIMEARRKCYRNLETGEVRDWFYSTMGELAQSAGFSAKKILRLLRMPHAQKFIRYKPTYVYCPELGKKVRGKCLFRVSLDDPLIPEDEVNQIAQEIHKDVSFQSPPKRAFDCKVIHFEKPPTGQIVRNSYSTIRDININFNNTTVTYSQKGGTVQAEQESLPIRKKRYQTPEKYEPIFHEIKEEIGRNSILARTILSSCFIADLQAKNDTASISIDVPNRYYKAVLESRYRERMHKFLEQKFQLNIVLQIVVSPPVPLT